MNIETSGSIFKDVTLILSLITLKLKGKSILVTGGAGFLGGGMVEDLLRQGAEVEVIDNLSVGSVDSIPNGVVDFIEGDVNRTNLDKFDTQYDMVFHYAAPCTVLMFDKSPMKMYMNAISAAYNIRKFCTENNIEYMAYASSATYYGKTSHKWTRVTPDSILPIYNSYTGNISYNPDSETRTQYKYQEDMPPRPANVYGCTKTAEENLDTLFPEVTYLGLRYFPVYGAREWLKGDVASVPYKFSQQILNGMSPEIWGSGTQSRDYIYIDDATYCTRTLVERDASGYYNIGTGRLTTMIDLISYINEYLNTYITANFVKNPYESSYLHSLISDPTKTLDIIGKYEFISVRDGIELILDEIGRV